MAQYIDKEEFQKALQRKKAGPCNRKFIEGYNDAIMRVKSMVSTFQISDVAPAVHGTPVLRYRPERYERYEEAGLNDRGEMLYIKRVYVDEKNWAMYCPACGKRLCSRFINYCPHCGAKMDGGLAYGKT